MSEIRFALIPWLTCMSMTLMACKACNWLCKLLMRICVWVFFVLFFLVYPCFKAHGDSFVLSQGKAFQPPATLCEQVSLPQIFPWEEKTVCQFFSITFFLLQELEPRQPQGVQPPYLPLKTHHPPVLPAATCQPQVPSQVPIRARNCWCHLPAMPFLQ